MILPWHILATWVNMLQFLHQIGAEEVLELGRGFGACQFAGNFTFNKIHYARVLPGTTNSYGLNHEGDEENRKDLTFWYLAALMEESKYFFRYQGKKPAPPPPGPARRPPPTAGDVE